MATYAAGEKASEKAAPKRGKKRLDHMRIHHADNGGHIVEHHFEMDGMGPMHEPETHIFAEHEGGKLLDHIAHHMKVTDTEEEGESPEFEAGEKEGKKEY